MPKMKLNIDFSRAKSFLLAKGERLALAVCGGFVLLLVIGFMGSIGFGKPKDFANWPTAIKTRADELRLKVEAAEARTSDDSVKPKKEELTPNEGLYSFVWPFFPAHSFFELPDKIDTKWRHPTVLPLRPERAEVAVLQGGYFAYNADPIDYKVEVFAGSKGTVGAPMPMPGPMALPMGGAAGAGPRPVRLFKPVRMVVVQGVFPMKEQINAYRSALRLSSLADLLDKPDLLPRPTGLMVWRLEKPADGDWAKALAANKAVKIYDAEAKSTRTKIDKAFPRTRELFQFGILDASEPHIYGPHVVDGLMTPLPVFANVIAKAPTLSGIEVDETLRKGTGGIGGVAKDMPMPPMPMSTTKGLPGFEKKDKLPPGEEAGEGGVTERIDWNKLATEKDRFEGKLNPFPTRSELRGELDPAKGGVRPMGGDIRMPPMGSSTTGPMTTGATTGEGASPLPDDALVRFIDADVLPGRTYKYWVKVRLANPMHGAKYEKEAAYKELTQAIELINNSPAGFWEVPQEVTIPNEFFYYIVDETPRADIKDGSDSPAKKKGDVNHLPIQIHRWVWDVPSGGANIPTGDWAIAERLLVRKGEYIGRISVNVELPQWKKNEDGFRLDTWTAAPTKKGPATKGGVAGVPVDFQGDYSEGRTVAKKYALVDFDGGHIKSSVAPKGEESEIRALVMTPEGKLTVRGSRADQANTERETRVRNWKSRIERILRGPVVPAPMGSGSSSTLPGAPK